MNSRETDILNVILIIISLMLAFSLPFGLFIFSYAILGPLHYLTEINWLKEKKYFVQNTGWIWLFVGIVLVLSIPFFLRLGVFSAFSENPAVKNTILFINASGDELILVSLLFAIGLIHFKKRQHLVLFLLGSIAIALPFLYYLPGFAMALVVFIPTLIHVYLFTLLFMAYGTLNSKSTPGIIAILLLLLIPVIIMMSTINPADYYNVREYTRTSFDDSNFGVVHGQVFKMLQIGGSLNYFSVIGIKIQIFIAFAYTYHYLNWFSKTSIIGWNKNLSRNKTMTILTIWILSIALYLYNFKIGFIALSFLSLIHVFLEFPLNVTSIKGILTKIRP